MQELMQSLGDDDPLGLRERLLIMYDHPRCLRSTQLQDACRRIPEPTLDGYLAKHFWQLHVAHTPGHGVQGFLKDLGYHWLHYSWSDEAAQSFWDNFDERAGEQESAYKADQQAAKRAGKGKTRRYRLAVPLHNLAQACAHVDAANWSTVVPDSAAKASVLFSSYMDEVFSKLDLHRQKPPDPGPAPSPAPALQPRRDDLRQILSLTSIDRVLENVSVAHIQIMVIAVLRSQRLPVLRHTDILHLRPVTPLNLAPAVGQWAAARAAKVMELLGLGTASVSNNATGVRVIFFAKRPQGDYAHAALQGVFAALQLDPGSKPLQEIQACRKATQPEIVFSDLNSESTAASIASALQAWQAAALAAGA